MKKIIIIIIVVSILAITTAISSYVFLNKSVENKKAVDTNDKGTNETTKDKEKNIENKNENQESTLLEEERELKTNTNTNTSTNNNANTNTNTNNKNERNENQEVSHEKETKNQNENNSNQEKKNTEERIEASKVYYCSSPYILENNKCVYSLKSEALIKYFCTEGNQNGTQCEITSTVEYIPNKYGVAAELCAQYNGSGYYNTCLCTNDGGTFRNNKCYKTVRTTKNATIDYYCPDSFNLIGQQCIKYFETDAPFKLDCPNGYKLNGNYCVK